MSGALRGHYVLQYTYKRSLGPVLGRFMGALRERRIEGVRTASGRVLVPPAEYDPDTGEPTGEPVEVGPEGVVESWAFVERPRAKHPLDTPFAWALIRLDGADTAMLHVVRAARDADLSHGMRVRPRWRDEREGSIRDILCFERVEDR
jgi:uncharacterized OB-fold protein